MDGTGEHRRESLTAHRLGRCATPFEIEHPTSGRLIETSMTNVVEGMATLLLQGLRERFDAGRHGRQGLDPRVAQSLPELLRLQLSLEKRQIGGRRERDQHARHVAQWRQKVRLGDIEVADDGSPGIEHEEFARLRAVEHLPGEIG